MYKSGFMAIDEILRRCETKTTGCFHMVLKIDHFNPLLGGCQAMW